MISKSPNTTEAFIQMEIPHPGGRKDPELKVLERLERGEQKTYM